MKNRTKSTLIGLSILAFVACKKEKIEEPVVVDTLQKDIVISLATNVNTVAYSQLSISSANLYTEIVSFCGTPSEVGLTNCRNLWKSTRAIWEQSEGFLYGPVSSENIDPRIDTWPVDYTALENVLSSSITFSESEINGLDDALKGFHPIEYLLFGQTGTKTFDQFTTREKEYLVALTLNLKELTQTLSTKWNSSTPENFYNYFINPSATNPYYTTQLQVYLEIVNAMVGICDEVGNGKITEPFVAQDPSLEESPFAFNSLTDFTNNIKSVQNVYLGNFSSDQSGLDDLVKKYNLSLDQSINTKINAAITALNNISGSFSSAIINEPVQVQNAIDAINALKNELETGLIPFVQLYVK